MIVSKKGKSGTELRMEGPAEILCAEVTMILVALQDAADQTDNKSIVDKILVTFLRIRDKANEKGISLAELVQDTSADDDDCNGRLRS